MQLFLVLIIVELSNIYDGGILYNMEYYRSGYCVRDYIGEEDIIYIFFSLLGQGYHLLCFLLIMISNSSIMLYINACTWHLKNISTKKKKRKKKYSSPIKSTFPVRRVSVCSACVQSMFYLPCIFSFPGYSQHSRWNRPTPSVEKTSLGYLWLWAWEDGVLRVILRSGSNNAGALRFGPCNARVRKVSVFRGTARGAFTKEITNRNAYWFLLLWFCFGGRLCAQECILLLRSPVCECMIVFDQLEFFLRHFSAFDKIGNRVLFH